MSAAPRAKTDEPQDDPASSASDAAAAAAAADAEGWALLESLRRRLDEQANQHRKTHADVRQLAESIGSLVREQRKRSLWINVNSFVAYLMFTLLCSGAFYFMYQRHAQELVTERDRARSERDEAVARANESLAKIKARDDADAKAMLDAKAKAAAALKVETAFKDAQAAFKAGHYADVIAPLEASLVLEPTGARAAQMHYYVGVSYAKTAELEKAATHLEAALAGDVEFEDARFHLASVLDRAGQWGKAKVEYDRFATAHPTSPHAAYASGRGATLTRFPPVRPAGASNMNTPAQPVAPAAPPGVPAAIQKAPAPKAAAPTPKAPAQPAPKTIDFNDPSTE